MSGRGVGGMGAGCAGLSLISLLVGVGLTLWLGAKVLEATDPTPSPRTVSLADELEPSVTLEPATGLRDGSTVTVTGTGLGPGAVAITPCVMDEAEARCDGDRTIDAVADADGTLSATATVAVTITVEAMPVDCQVVACALIVHPPGRFEGPSASLVFGAG